MNTRTETLAAVEAALRRAGAMLLAAHDIHADEKSGRADLVTEYDKKIQAFLERELLAIRPGAGFLGEEDEFVAPRSGKLFIVDPIDGTTNFIRGFKKSCISAALEEDGEVTLGAVYDPYLDEMYSATLGGGAFLNGKPISASERDMAHAIVLFGSSPYDHELAHKSFAAAEALFTLGLDVRRMASAALDLCYIAAGRAEVYFEYVISPWDHAAGQLIAREAGAIVSTHEGQPLDLRKRCSILACGRNCERELRGTLSAIK